MKISGPLAAFGIALLLLGIGSYSGLGEQKFAGQPFPTPYSEAETFATAIDAAEMAAVPHRGVSGITVPHHLLAADLIARSFRIAENNRYDKIVILSPDHFKKTRRPFATTHRAFETVFGVVETSEKDVAHLLNDGRIVEESNLFLKEHGLAALLPFVKHYFPETPIVPIAVSLSATPDELERLIADLEPVITDGTLILQSTDFSHYLPHHEAILRDSSDSFGNLWAWNIETRKKLAELPPVGAAQDVVDVAADEHIALTAGNGGKVTLYDLDTDRILRQLDMSAQSEGAGFGPDGKRIASIDTEGVLHVWSHIDGDSEVFATVKVYPEELAEQTSDPTYLRRLTWLPELSAIAIATSRGEVKLVCYDVKAWRRRARTVFQSK